MSRHSKWHKVRQFKGAIDAKRAASFTKLAREIVVAAKEKGGDPNMNPRLRAAIDRARAVSMPKDNIDRAVQRGIGGQEEGVIETLTYEAYAPGGTGLIIECLTDNRNRSASDVKHLLSKHGGSLAASGAVTYLFDRFGVVRIPVLFPVNKKDEIELALIEAGAEDVIAHEEETEIRCKPIDLAIVAEKTVALGFVASDIEMEWIPKTLVETDETIGMQVAELVDALEAHDDVSRIYSNLA